MTIRATPQQNGVSERFNRTIKEGITTMLSQARLPPNLWVEAARAFVHIHNRFPSSSINFRTPYELWTGRIPSLKHLRVWGCLAYVHLQKDQRSHFGPHARRCIFLGYADDYKGWIFWDPEKRVEVISDDAEFAEDKFPGTLRGRIGAEIVEDPAPLPHQQAEPQPNHNPPPPQDPVRPPSPAPISPRPSVVPEPRPESRESSPDRQTPPPRASVPLPEHGHRPILLTLPGRLQARDENESAPSKRAAAGRRTVAARERVEGDDDDDDDDEEEAEEAEAFWAPVIAEREEVANEGDEQ